MLVDCRPFNGELENKVSKKYEDLICDDCREIQKLRIEKEG